MTKKRTLAYVLTGALSVGIFGAIPAFAAEKDIAKTNDSAVVENETDPAFGGHRGGGHGKFHLNEEQLQEKAEELGIDSTDKDSRELAKEIMDAELQKRAKELGIETEGKDHRAVMEEIRGVELTEKAKTLGISTEGKDHQELKKEIFEASILKAAKELGIETEGKTTKELMDEIMTDHADEAKELDFFPFNKEKDHFFRMGGKGHHGPGHGKRSHESAPDTKQNGESSAESKSETL
ncbi:hypothetical protein AAEO50_05335 [Rossellomorea oryzaecorticis]|uniref:Uncharacterized protein n=1 Tax=Rossellomorea oryzaecorticis TaxID=1396505 RepID=A0ABU9K6K5_9BACI